MEPDSLVKLVGSGNSATVEEEWMRLTDAAEQTSERWIAYQSVVAELTRLGRTDQAEGLAWAAIESVAARESPSAALKVAGAFLLAMGESSELRNQVADLYRTTHNGTQELEALLTESGLPGGRPVRRALRTLEVALAIHEGGYLTSRDDGGAARVDRIERGPWRVTISIGSESETLDIVQLADRYEPARPDDFRVMRIFAGVELADRLNRDPAAVVIDLCKRLGNRIDGDRLEEILVPDWLNGEEWKKWFAKARTALKSDPHVKIEGRSPYVITVLDAPQSLEDVLTEEFEKLHEPLEQLAAVDRYLRECKSRKQTPSSAALRDCADRLRHRASATRPPTVVEAGVLWLAAQRVAELAGLDDAAKGPVHWFRGNVNLSAFFGQVKDESLLDRACACLVEARPDAWKSDLLSVLPLLPLEICDRAARRLIDAGCTVADFEPAVQRVLSSPVAHFEALLWLWNGPSGGNRIPAIPLLTLLTRIFRTLEECRQNERVPRETVRHMGHRARSVLSAREFERFVACLTGMEAGMAVAIRAQIRRLDVLGRSVRDEMLALIRRHFSSLDAPPPVLLPWEREDVLYVTEQGLARKQVEMDHHVNVKMRENAAAIGRAAAHGDLSENSEYKFALEERDLLRARLAQMNAELAKARVLSPTDVPTDHVGIGSRVRLKRLTDGLPYELTIVGPWESDPDAGYFNYLAPFCREVLGKKPGDSVELNHSGLTGTFEIVSIQNGLLELAQGAGI